MLYPLVSFYSLKPSTSARHMREVVKVWGLWGTHTWFVLTFIIWIWSWICRGRGHNICVWVLQWGTCGWPIQGVSQICDWHL